MFENKRFLITGGAGFIGSELVHQLAEKDAEIIVVDNLVNGKRENLDDILSNKVVLEVEDIRDDELMTKLMQGVDYVFHLACLGVRHSIHSPLENHEVNATATLKLLIRAREAGVKRFVYVSSSEVYGTAHQVPMTEECPTYPHTVYGSSKLAGDCYTRAFWTTHKYPTTVVRPFNSYGPRSHHEGDSGEAIPKFLLRALTEKPMIVFGDGTQTRDFTFVADTARGILEAGLSENTLGETINIGYGEEFAIKDLAKIVAETVGKPEAPIEHIEPRPGDVLRLYSDITKARELIGFSPRINMREGLKRLLEWYQAQGINPEELLRNETVRNWEK
ncbi:GDP-mannose 4,6-dehydratase [bacterium]|nr:GDP-mannose 4,6-dehydratase [bacterium]